MSGWTLDGTSYAACATNTSCQLSNVMANHSLQVTFVATSVATSVLMYSNANPASSGSLSAPTLNAKLITADGSLPATAGTITFHNVPQSSVPCTVTIAA